MVIVNYRYSILTHTVKREEIDVRETQKCYVGEYCRMFKREDDIAMLKGAASAFPYIEFYSTKDPSKEHAVENILKYFESDLKEAML